MQPKKSSHKEFIGQNEPKWSENSNIFSNIVSHMASCNQQNLIQEVWKVAHMFELDVLNSMENS